MNTSSVTGYPLRWGFYQRCFGRSGNMEEDIEAQYYQSQLERQERLVEALRKARSCQATDDDWNVIYYECGINKELL